MTKLITLMNWKEFTPDQAFYKGKIVLVTGAASGIGRAATLALAKQGVTVLMLDKKVRHLEKLYDEMLNNGMQEPVILPVDLLELTAESATQIAQGVLNDFSKLDALIHIAGELGSPSPMDQYDLDYWQQAFKTNLQAPYLLTRALLPLLKQDYSTQILFTSSTLGREPKAYAGAYGISYAGIEAQMKIWAQELETVTKIKVNSFDPGPVRTVMRRRSHPGENQDRLTTPQEVALAYLQLLENREDKTEHQFTLA